MTMKAAKLLSLTCLAAPAASFGFAGLESLTSAGAAAHDAIANGVPSFLDHPTTNAIANAATAGTAASSSAPGIDLLAAYKAALASDPLRTKMITGATLASAGDAIAQRREDGPYDIRRGASFVAFDACYRALQHTLFPPIVKYCDGSFLLGVAAAVGLVSQPESADPFFFGAMEQTLASQLGIVPFLYYPVFFTLTGFVQGLTPEASVQRAKDTFLPLMKRNLLFWIPVQFVQFGFVEEGLQIPFLCVCGLAWTFILSIMAGSTKNYCVTGSEADCVLPDDLFPHADDEVLVSPYLDLSDDDGGRVELDSLVRMALDNDEALDRTTSLDANGSTTKVDGDVRKEEAEVLTR